MMKRQIYERRWPSSSYSNNMHPRTNPDPCYNLPDVSHLQVFPKVHITMGESCLGLGINLISRMQYLPAIPLLEESFANYQQVAMAMGVTGL